MKPATLLLFALLAIPSLAADDAEAPDAGKPAGPTQSELQQLRAAQSVALLKLNGAATADCTSIGWNHVKLDVVTARPGRATRTAHYSFALHVPGPDEDSYFVAALALEKWVPQKHLCLPASMASDAQVKLLVRVASKEEGYALLNKLRRDTPN